MRCVLETREQEICTGNKRTRDLYLKQENKRFVLEIREQEICTRNKRTRDLYQKQENKRFVLKRINKE